MPRTRRQKTKVVTINGRRIVQHCLYLRPRPGGRIVIGPYGGLVEFLGNWRFLPKMPFDVIKGVFVEKDMGRMYPGWERMPKGKAKQDGRKVITCSFGGVWGRCKFHAVLLDPDWPLSDTLNRCSLHVNRDRLGLKNKPRDRDRHIWPRKHLRDAQWRADQPYSSIFLR